MKLQWVLAVCTVMTCSKSATIDPTSAPNRLGLEKPTDQPVQISDYDLSALLNNVFPDSTSGNGEVEASSSTTSVTPVDTGRGPDNDNSEGSPVENTEGNEAQDCECVPYYLCSTNRTIIENGEGLIDIRMKSGLCEQYLDVCCRRTDTVDDAITPRPPQTFSDTCGKRNFEGVSSLRITGAQDNEAQFGEFPWVVAVIQKGVEKNGVKLNVFQCGGSLINQQVVLTAAHCVKNKTNLSIRAGEWDSQTQNEPLKTQSRAVREIIIHEEFYPGALYNDVALLFLDTPVDLAANVGTVCLPEQGENMDGRDCVASGWGKDIFGKEGKYQVILKKVELPVVPRAPCIEALHQTRLGKHFQLHSSFMCAGGKKGKDTCQGDGGGPLACPTPNNPGIYVQAGIVAWGIGCGTTTPGVYVDVAKFRNWIDNKMSIFDIDIKLNEYSKPIN